MNFMKNFARKASSPAFSRTYAVAQSFAQSYPQAGEAGFDQIPLQRGALWPDAGNCLQRNVQLG
jgi:hypothetical protein